MKHIFKYQLTHISASFLRSWLITWRVTFAVNFLTLLRVSDFPLF